MTAPAHLLKLNGKACRAASRQTLLDAALDANIHVPHDCKSGLCEACRVSVMNGTVDAAGSELKATVLACQAKPQSDCDIEWDGQAEPVEWRGRVCHFEPLSEDLIEFDVRFQGSPAWMTGQYFKAQWKSGFEVQVFPCFSMARPPEFNTITFHLWPETLFDGLHRPRNPLKDGKAIRLLGPFGTSFLRFEDERLILIANEQGISAIWALAMAATRGQPLRPKIVLVDQALAERNELQPAFSLLDKRNVKIAVFDSDAADLPRHFQELIPDLTEYDAVHAAGTFPVLQATKTLAKQTGCTLRPIPLMDPIRTV